MKKQEMRIEKLEDAYGSSKDGIWQQYFDWRWSFDKYVIADCRMRLNQDDAPENIKEICRIVLHATNELFEVQPADQDTLDEALASIPDDLYAKMCAVGLME